MVKILIERHVRKGKEGYLMELLNKLRTELISQPGYVSGELLQSLEDKATIYAISTWFSTLDWKSWEGDPRRLAIESRIESLLTDSPRLTVASAF
ncbi:MAG: antibiotic biosynthesis monooxygenase [Deltaproteobacteria bacterium]|nr:antibiotic biosynthesis monooxygenase [Deltaproteobacteria bacterium]